MKKKKMTQAQHYQTNRWRGRLHWQCDVCNFDTLNGVTVMLRHLKNAHNILAYVTSDQLVAEAAERTVNEQ